MAESKEAWVKAISIFIILVGMISNGIVIVVLCAKSSRRILQKWRNMYILHQSAVDFTSLLVVALIRLIPIGEEALRHDTLGANLLCKFWVSEYLLWSMLTCSTYNLALVSLERYLAVVHPIYHRTSPTKNKVMLSMLLPWIIGFAVQSYWPPLHVLDTANGTCFPRYTCEDGSPTTLQAVLSIYSFTFEFGIALLIMCFAYGSIIVKLTFIIKRKEKKRNVYLPKDGRHPGEAVSGGGRRKNNVYAISRPTPPTKEKKSRDVFSDAKRDILKTFLAVFASYVICWTPTEVVYLRHNLCIEELSFDSGVYDGLSILVVVNAVINPLIYSGLYLEFQKQLMRVLRCPCGGRTGDPNGVGETSSQGTTGQVSNTRNRRLETSSQGTEHVDIARNDNGEVSSEEDRETCVV